MMKIFDYCITVAILYCSSHVIAYASQSEIKEFPWPQFRLPKNFHPLHYSLFIHPHPENDTFSGLVTIDLMVTQWSSWLILNAYQLNVSRVVIIQSKEADNKIWDNVVAAADHVTMSDEWQMMAVKLPEESTISSNDEEWSRDSDNSSSNTLRVTISYTGRMQNEDRFGFYKGYYHGGSDGKTKKPMYVAHNVPAYARRMLPCFDEPGFKANFTLSVVRPVDMLALSNMPLDRTENFTAVADGFVVDHFQTSVKMSTFLLTVVICDFVSRSAMTKRGLKMSVYAPENLINLTISSLETGVRAVEYLEDYFQIPYSLPKLDMTMTNDFQNTGVENWGLILFDPNHYLVHNDSETWNFDKKRQKLLVVIHEIVHQWIGNLVSVKYWSEIWLIEGITEFVGQYVFDKMYPNSNMTKTLATGYKDRQMNSDSSDYTRAIRFYEKNPAYLRGLFSWMTYYKGAILTNLIMDLLGEERFRTFMSDYLKRYSFDSVEEKEFFGALNEHSPSYDNYRLGDFIGSFSDQPGFPLINVEKINHFRIKIQQTRFFNDISLMNSTNQTWKVPLTFVDDSGVTKVFALVNSTQVINVNSSSKWFKLNVNNTGFYRVNYDADSWQALFDQLVKNKTVMSARDRYGLYSDMFAMFEHKSTANLTQIFAFLRAFSGKEDDRRCFNLLLEEMMGIGERLTGTLIFADFQEFVKTVLSNVDNIYEWSLVTEKHMKEWSINKAMNAITHFDLGQFRMTAHRMVTQHLFGNEPSNLLQLEPFLLCTSALQYNQSLWQPIFDMLYGKVEGYWQKEAYFTCLLHSNQSDNIYRLLDSIENNTGVMYYVESYHYYNILRKAFSMNPDGMQLYWQYMKDHFENHFNTLPYQRFVNFVYPLYYFNTLERYNEIESFFNSKNISEGRSKKINDILTTIHSNIESANEISQAFENAFEI